MVDYTSSKKGANILIISLITAYSTFNNAIGKDNELLWHIPEDFEQTSDYKVVCIDRVVEDFKPYEYTFDGSFTGEEMYSKNGGEVLWGNVRKATKHRGFTGDVYFKRTGYIEYEVRREDVHNCKDALKPVVWGVGFIGEKGLSVRERKLYSIWQSMLERCYNPKHPQYKNYGGRGVFVQGEWHSFSNFVRTVKEIKNWDKKINDWTTYSLDKDYYGGNCYSKRTCVWISSKEQHMYRRNNQPFVATLPNGKSKLFLERDRCVEEIGINKNVIKKMLGNKIKDISKSKYRDFSFKFIKVKDKLYRYEL